MRPTWNPALLGRFGITGYILDDNCVIWNRARPQITGYDSSTIILFNAENSSSKSALR
jgi:hypothetical protein